MLPVPTGLLRSRAGRPASGGPLTGRTRLSSAVNMTPGAGWPAWNWCWDGRAGEGSAWAGRACATRARGLGGGRAAEARPPAGVRRVKAAVELFCNLAAMDVREVAVVGLGTMGPGIVEVFARAGLRVVAIEVDPDALERGMATLGRSLAKAVSRGKLTEPERAEVLARVRPARSVQDAAGADLAVEVVPERMDIKRQVFAELEHACAPEAILVTNTSSLSVTEIAATTQNPSRVAGMHFFNPAPVMRLVEVVTTVRTAAATGQAVTDLVRRLGKTPVQVTDRSGFVANALLLPYLNHAAALLETGFAVAGDIDAAVTSGIGLPMGPLALLDLIGLDTALSIIDVLHGEFGGSRYTAAPVLRRLVAAGLTGRKAGRGFYEYEQARPASPPGPDSAMNAKRPASPAPLMLIDARGAEGGQAGAGPGTPLARLIEQAGWPVAGHDGPRAAGPGRDGAGAGGLGAGHEDAGAGGLIIVLAADETANILGAALATGRAADAVGLHLAGDKLAELIVTPVSAPGAVELAAAVAGSLGRTVVRCHDRPGFLAGTLLYPHLNDAVRMIQDGYASAAGIDTAMELGCGYPHGPLQLLDQAGPRRALAVLTRMYERYGDPAFAPVPLLAEFAAAGLAFR
jgi:3-hydroxybutyryl-CoA dehydrogenase